MLSASDEARNAAMLAISSGELDRPSGIVASIRRTASSRVILRLLTASMIPISNRLVRVAPGQIALTLILYRASCEAPIRVMAMTAPLVPAYAILEVLGKPLPAIDAILTIFPAR